MRLEASNFQEARRSPLNQTVGFLGISGRTASHGKHRCEHLEIWSASEQRAYN